VIVMLTFFGAAALGQQPPTTAPSSAESPLHVRQQSIQDRWQRLESRMLRLSRQLAETEPEQVERLHEALDRAGEKGVRRRVEELITLLRSGRLSDAEREQQALLTDLEALLELLTSTTNELDLRRAERQRLEGFKRTIRRLMDEQTEDLHRLRQSAERDDAGNATDESLRELERLQRQTQEKASKLQDEMRPRDEPSPPTPGIQPVGRAVESMRDAGDRIGERQFDEAQERQQKALEELQSALNELDDALRQVRREELEETLTALEIRFRRMLERERGIREEVAALHEKGTDRWAHAEQRQLGQLTEAQLQVADDCDTTLRILLDEGTTVIMPELVRQLAGDMRAVADALDRGDVSESVRGLLDDIIELLEEIVGAIQAKRDADTRATEQGDPRAAQGGPQSLLPGSAELKLLRSAQLRINARTAALDEAGAREQAERLAARQRRLSELARQMSERD